MPAIRRSRLTFARRRRRINLSRLFSEVKTFADKIFPPGRSPIAVLKHMQKEIELELIPYGAADLIEWADLLILFRNGRDLAGFNPELVLAAAFAKMSINRSRPWQKPDAEGVIEHVRSESEVRA